METQYSLSVNYVDSSVTNPNYHNYWGLRYPDKKSQEESQDPIHLTCLHTQA